jgi:hypothetical protein
MMYVFSEVSELRRSPRGNAFPVPQHAVLNLLKGLGSSKSSTYYLCPTAGTADIRAGKTVHIKISGGPDSRRITLFQEGYDLRN